MTANGGTLTVTVHADAAWLNDSHRAYPLTIDPTIKIAPTVSQSQDAMIISVDPASNFDGSWRLSVGTTATGKARSLVKFDLSTIPAGTQIDSAQLRMYYDQTHTADQYSVPIEAHRVTAPWDQTTVTWNSANTSLGELGYNQEQVDDADTAKIAIKGSWPSAANTGAVNGSYRYNKDAVTGDTFSWVPRVTEAGSYAVDAHHVAGTDRPTAAPYTVTYNGGTTTKTVNQASGSGGVWAGLGSFPFVAGTTGKVVLGDTSDSSKTTVADAVRLTKNAIDTKTVNQANVWHSFSVRSTVQSWLNGAQPNYGFMLKATDKATLGHGGPRYEAAEYAYNGENDNTPRLLVTYGRPGVSLDPPTTITSTGANLHWSGYTDPNPADPNDDIVEYQVHRSVYQAFTPNPATLVAPVPAGTTAFNDTTATPTPVDSPDPFGQDYFYMVVVKTRDGQLIPAPTREAHLPRAGRVTQLFQGGPTIDTSLSSALPTANEDAPGGSPWLMVGDNSATYGRTRAVVKFPDLSAIPAGAQVQDATLHLWAFTMVGGATATYEAHALTRDFDETTASWNKANATTSWTSPGGDYNPTVADTVGSMDLHPPGQAYPTDVTLTDGDGTSHLFTLNKHGSSDPAVWDYDHPHGVHLYLQKTNLADTSRSWVMTRPDRTQVFFDDEGYQTAIVDKNGNTLQFTYAERKSNNAPRKFLQYITDPASRQTLTLTYYAKGDSYSYIDDSGNEVQAGNLTNPKIIDNVKTITDVSGRQLALTYTDKGLLAKLVDGAGNPAAKTFRFGYDATNTNKNTKLVSVTDPRGHSTALKYYDAPTDPKFKWAAQTITDRAGGTTNLGYTDPDGPQGGQINTEVTDPENHAATYVMDGFGRPTTMTNAKQQTTTLGWDGDHNVTRLTENNGAVSTWRYDPNTGYPLTATDAEAGTHGWPVTTFSYATGLSGHIADLASKSSPEGRTWTFGHDPAGDLTSVTDPAGSATPTAGDYTTTSTYDSFGQLLTATDANQHTTTFSNYDPTGYPKTTTDPLSHATGTVYDPRGNVTSVTDALGHTSTHGYDVFGRPLDSRVPKDQAAGVYITTPAPVYDANDNITTATAPNGAVTTADYDTLDRTTAVHAPKNAPTDPDRTTSYGYDKVGNLTSTTQPNGTLTPSDPNDYTTRNSYDEIYQLTDTTDAAGDKTSYSYDNDGNVTTLVDPRKNATPDATDYTTKYGYDLDHRVTSTTDAAGNVTRQGYDKDGKVTSSTDQAGNTTLITLDARALTSQVDVPFKTGGTITYKTTQYGYDQVGNRTKTTSPRGAATPADPTDYATVTVYDPLNRVIEQDLPYNQADPTYHTPDKILSTYDAVGRLTKTSAPPSAGQTVRNDTSYSYFDNGWTKTSTDPWDIVTSYDYNELGQQTQRTITSAGGSSSRVMGWAYNPDGTLKSRTDSGVPVGKQVVLVDNSDTQNVKATGTWATSTTGSGFYGYDYRSHAAGTGANTFAWTLNVPQAGSYQVFVRYAAGTASNAPFKIDYNGGSVTKPVNQTTGAGQWVSLGSYSFAEGNAGKITLSDQANGTVVADAVKLVRDNSGDTQPAPNGYSNSYDPNGNLTGIADTSPGSQIDGYAIGYDQVNRVQQVQEKLAGTVKHTTGYSYDQNGDPLTQTHDTQVDAYEYDVRNLLAKVTNKTSVSDPNPKITTYAYTAAGTTATENKDNGNTVAYDYNLDWSLAHQVEKKPSGTVVAEHTLDYDLNGNKTRDTSTVQNADDHAQLLHRVTVDSYDPRDRTATVTETNPDTGASVSTESYVHDANNNVVSQTINGAATAFGYDRNRLQTATTGGATAGYNYDPFGRLDTVTAAGTQLERYVYDGFDRTVKHTKQGAGTSTYAYDPFDRTTSETTDAGGANQKTTDYAYLGLTSQLLTESVNGTVTKTYQYSPTGKRLSQTTHNTDGTSDTADYGYSPHADVETLTDSNGDTKATYGYTGYGTTTPADVTGLDKPTLTDPTKTPYNVYRYAAKRFDPATGTIDMGFRTYAPGLNSFLTRDSYNGALADQNLTTDPWTGNRYAFTGGNPTTHIELDGHRLACVDDTFTCDKNGVPPQTNINGGTPSGNTSGCADPEADTCGGTGGGSQDAPTRLHLLPNTNDPSYLFNIWSYGATYGAGTYWNPLNTPDGPACYGAWGCKQAYYVLMTTGDVDAAKEAAGNYCLDHPDACASDARGFTAWSADAQAMLFMLGGAAGGLDAFKPYAADEGAGGLSTAYHYTGAQNVASIESNGLRAGAYATPNGELSPLQAQIDLALPPNRGLPGATLRIDLNGLRNAGYDIPSTNQVGRSFNMPGGGTEMQFPYPIPPEFIKVMP